MRALNGICAPNSFKLLEEKKSLNVNSAKIFKNFLFALLIQRPEILTTIHSPLLINIYLVGAKCINEPSILLMAALPLILNPFALSSLSLTCRGL